MKTKNSKKTTEQEKRDISKIRKDKRKAKELERQLPSLLKLHSPELIKQIIYPQAGNNKYTALIKHPNTQKVLWEKKFGPKTDLNKIWNSLNVRYMELKKKIETWVKGTEKHRKIDVSKYS